MTRRRLSVPRYYAQGKDEEDAERFKKATALAKLVVLKKQDDGSYVLDWADDFDTKLWANIQDGLWDSMICSEPTLIRKEDEPMDYAYYMAWEIGKKILEAQGEAQEE